MRLRIVLVVLGSLVGCARVIWTKADFNQADWNRDTYECERDMRQSGYFGTGLAGAINAQEFQERCLMAKGYYKVAVPRENRVSPPPPPPARAASPAWVSEKGSPSCTGADKKTQISALQQQLDEGKITRDNFETRRAKIIMEPVFEGCE